MSVSHWMGHASVTITLETYAHFPPDNGVRGRTDMDAWLDNGAPKPPAAVDLRASVPLRYTETSTLSLPTDGVGSRPSSSWRGLVTAGPGPWAYRHPPMPLCTGRSGRTPVTETLRWRPASRGWKSIVDAKGSPWPRR